MSRNGVLVVIAPPTTPPNPPVGAPPPPAPPRPLDYVPKWAWRFLPVKLMLWMGWTHRDVEDRQVKFMLKSTGAWSILESIEEREAD